MHLVQLGKPRHRDGQAPASPWLIGPNHEGHQAPSRPLRLCLCSTCSSFPLSFPVAPPQQPQVRGLGPGERPLPLPCSPCCYGHCPGPHLPEAPSARPLPSARPGPLRTTQLVLQIGPHPVPGPLIRNGWGLLAGEGREPGGGPVGEREALPRQSLPTCPPPAQRRPGQDQPGQWPQMVQRAVAWRKGPCTAQSRGPPCRDQV